LQFFNDVFCTRCSNYNINRISFINRNRNDYSRRGGETKPKLTLSGSADVYFRANLKGGANEAGQSTTAPATSFANLPGFGLGMGNLVAQYETPKAGVKMDLVFGPRGSDAVFGSPLYSNSASIINQLYAYWNINEQLTLTMGNFNTFLGYEVISPVDNFNYSTSYLFSYGPFSHTGLKLDYENEKGLSAMAAILNPTDITEFNPTNTYLVGLQVGYEGFYLNGLLGDGYTQIDLTGGVDLSDAFFVGVNASYTAVGEDSGFYGTALYTQYAVNESFSLGARYEFFNDTDGDYVFGTEIKNTNVSDFTLTGQYTTGNLSIIPELRLDSVSEAVFVDADGLSSKTLASVVVAFVYGF